MAIIVIRKGETRVVKPTGLLCYPSSAMMDGIDDIELRHGPRRAQAYNRAEPVIRCIEEAVRDHRRRTGDADGIPEIGALVALCTEHHLTAARGGPVSYHTVVRAMKLMGLR
ncbi:hypothetical protein U1707_01310 [Sphingomonas sp. PB2P12]|uniref:hypothetical protein n=1 Tax=Sphingomonas sandaracina TaxID=3096157 RepID=UPI002FCA508F